MTVSLSSEISSLVSWIWLWRASTRLLSSSISSLSSETFESGRIEK